MTCNSDMAFSIRDALILTALPGQYRTPPERTDKTRIVIPMQARPRLYTVRRAQNRCAGISRRL